MPHLSPGAALFCRFALFVCCRFAGRASQCRRIAAGTTFLVIGEERRVDFGLWQTSAFHQIIMQRVDQSFGRDAFRLADARPEPVGEVEK